ncbi:hypothetical protein [Streptomyces sp. SID8352]|uniref:hypothetical protein n=1 Tax=Streptomyces sp. SID8352 TaxID=2690338 RepID=UPI001368FC11|nr:hypothetical protein [Streptomyces sp. SID8352]MYU20786.1 hypothetical protein [Streptomyces sp. SID8352]
MSDQPWTIERISEAVGNPTLARRFLSEINRAPADQLLAVFTRWQEIAEGILAAVDRGREIAAAEERGEDPTAGWTDATDRVRAEADRVRSRGAA